MPRLLILVPTEYELEQLEPRLAQSAANAGGILAVCGFGPILAGILATRLITEHMPESVILVGIAGALKPKIRIGEAMIFYRIGCFGIGAGSGSEFRTATELGWNQWTAMDSAEPTGEITQIDSITAGISEEPILLTVCSASANQSDVDDRLRRFPHASAEDMEGYSVAMACQLANIPFTIIRGISNRAGDRDKANWNVAAALDAAAELTLSRIF
jgi:futalosine hydrolase